MGLSEQLAAFRAEFVRTAEPGRVALYQATIDKLLAEFAGRDPVGAGDEAPDFTLPDPRGGEVALSALLREGPVVLAFYRGGWCPYCNLQLRAYQEALPAIRELGARLVAVSPQLPDQSLSMAEKNALAFDVLSDVGNRVARSYGLVYTLAEELQEGLRAAGRPLSLVNGDDSWELPVPATYVIGPDRRIVAGEVDVDYRDRLDPREILAALEGLAAARPSTPAAS